MAGALNYYINNPRSNDRTNNQNVVILLLVGPSDDKARLVLHFSEKFHLSVQIKACLTSKISRFVQEDVNIFNVRCVQTLIFQNFSAIQQAQIIHDHSEDILVVGVTSAVDVDEIQQLTSSPRVLNQNYFLLDDYSDLAALPAILATGLCNRDTPGPCECVN